VVGAAALREGAIFFVPTVLAGLIALAISPPVRLLESIGVPRGFAAFGLVSGVCAAIGAAIYMLAPSAQSMANEAPAILRRLRAMALRIEREVADTLPSGSTDALGGDDRLIEMAQQIFAAVALNAPATLGALLYGGVLAFFLIHERDHIPRTVMSCAGSFRTRLLLGRAMRDVRLDVSRYLFAIGVINAGLAAATAAVFWAIGVPDAAVWGVATGVLNFVPYIGALILHAALLTIGLATFPSPEIALGAMGALLALNMAENNLVTPTLVGRRVELRPLAVFLAVAFGVWLWGAAGALIATPALLVVRAFGRRMIRAGKPRR